MCAVPDEKGSKSFLFRNMTKEGLSFYAIYTLYDLDDFTNKWDMVFSGDIIYNSTRY